MHNLLQEFAFPKRIRLFKWNAKSPNFNGSVDQQGLILFLIKYRFVSTPVTSSRKFSRPISHIFPFNVECLSSTINLQKLAFDALLSTTRFVDHNTITALANNLSEFLFNNYSFRVETLSNPDAPKVVIVVEINHTRVFKGFQGSDNIGDAIVKLEDQFNGEANSETEDNIVQRLIHMLEVPVLDLLEPSYVYESPELSFVPGLDLFEGCNKGDDESTCAICLEGLSMEACKKTSCSHVFHEGCIAQWLWRKTSCPMCRSQLV